MALVDYSSSDSESAVNEAATATTKRQKTSHDKTKAIEGSGPLPPLPAAFHDLYASTVRVSTSDDPALHQGRKRVNPHKAGNWPSHLYIEWHPTDKQCATLSALLSDLTSALSPLSVDLRSFLTSDLDAPQPLHISLSRPIVLSTLQKDVFLKQLIDRIRGSGIAPFDLVPRGLEWHRTRESERSFLVLRVAGAAATDVSPNDSSIPAVGGGGTGTAATGHAEEEEEEEEEEALTRFQANSNTTTKQPQNPELAQLLQRCNALVTEHQQPALYAFKDNRNGDDAFHISIAWSFAEPTAEVKKRTEEVFSRASEEERVRAEVLAMRVPVNGIKAKIGNVVTHVALPARGKGRR
ncbi:hypothetical protein F4677DRAFT_411458 [Hypoxylon crocopeplum]|nr:hypothetical protein F4677DRAFT_411458 [Hypoxylon crocopeplum]